MNIGVSYNPARLMPVQPVNQRTKSMPSPLKFQGEKTTQMASQNLYHPYKLIKLLRQDDTPYLGNGHVPPFFLQRTGLNETQLFSELDQLAQDLKAYLADQGIFSRLSRFLHGQAYNTLESKKWGGLVWHPNGSKAAPLPLTYCGQGSFGTVYKVGEGANALALKVYGHFASPYSAAEGGGVGMFLAARNIKKNVCEFYATNPFKHWGLMEFISYEATRNRTGITLKDADLEMADDHERNYRFGVRVDHNMIGKLGSGRYRDFFSGSTRTSTSLLWLFDSLTPNAYRYEHRSYNSQDIL